MGGTTSRPFGHSFRSQANTRGEGNTPPPPTFTSTLAGLGLHPPTRRGNSAAAATATATTVHGQSTHAVPLVRLDINFLLYPFLAIITLSLIHI